MTTKRRLQSESKGGSPTEATAPKVSRSFQPESIVIVEDLPNLPSSTCPSLRTSARVLRQKEERKESEGLTDDVHDNPTDIEDTQPSTDGNLVNGDSQKPKRAWELWSDEDQNLFFSALNEHGKNFVAIELVFQNKVKRSRGPVVNVFKNRDQIRHFYYRTLQKISKYLHFPDNLKKSTRELYALVNFGELRKKLGNSLDKFKCGKLQELVFKGSTSFKWKGKIFRLRTPTCPALVRLNTFPSKTISGGQGSSDGPQEIVLPKKVTLDLTPLTVQDYYRSNHLASCNPRISLTLRLERRLSAVLDRLKKKFYTIQDRSRTNCALMLNMESKPSCEWGELWLVPKPGTIFKRAILTAKEQTTSSSISLSNLQSKLEPNSSEEQTVVDPKPVVDLEKIIIQEEAHLNLEPCTSTDLTGTTFGSEETYEQGWNFESGMQVTIGELFLNIRQTPGNLKPVLHLNYTWKEINKSEEESNKAVGILEALAALASNELARKHSNKNQFVTVGSPLQLTKGPVLSQSPRSSDLECGTSSINAQSHESSVEFRRPAVPPAKSQQTFHKELELIPKYTQRKGRPMSRSKAVLFRQIQTVPSRPIQPKNIICSKNGSLKKLVSPNNSQTTELTFTSLPSQITVSVDHNSVPLLDGTSLTHLSEDLIPLISIPSPAVVQTEIHTVEEHNNVMVDNNFNVNLFDDNSRPDMDMGRSSTPSHLQVDHFLDSVLENSNNSLLQTPKRSSPPPSPPGGMSEHSWLPDLSLTSFLGSLPTDHSNHHHHGVQESPSKMMLSHHDDSMQSNGSEVDRQLSFMLSESSVDFTAKFAKLASALNSSD